MPRNERTTRRSTSRRSPPRFPSFECAGFVPVLQQKETKSNLQPQQPHPEAIAQNLIIHAAGGVFADVPPAFDQTQPHCGFCSHMR